MLMDAFSVNLTLMGSLKTECVQWLIDGRAIETALENVLITVTQFTFSVYCLHDSNGKTNAERVMRHNFVLFLASCHTKIYMCFEI